MKIHNIHTDKLGNTWTVDYDRGVQGQLKWVVMCNDWNALDSYLEREDQLWVSKTEAVDNIVDYLTRIRLL